MESHPETSSNPFGEQRKGNQQIIDMFMLRTSEMQRLFLMRQ